MSAGLIEFRKTYFPRNILMYKATLFLQFLNSVEFATLNWLWTWLSVNCKLSSAAILSTTGNFLLNSAFHLHADPEPGIQSNLRRTDELLRRAKQLSTAATHLCWSSISVVSMTCKVKSFYVVRSALLLCLSLQIFAGMSSWNVYHLYSSAFIFVMQLLFGSSRRSVAWLPKCTGDYLDQFPKSRNCGTGARAIFLISDIAFVQTWIIPSHISCMYAGYVHEINFRFVFVFPLCFVLFLFRFVWFHSIPCSQLPWTNYSFFTN